MQNTKKQERVTTSYILAAGWFLGLGGLHRLYNGRIGTGLLWLFTYGMFGIGQFVDLFLINDMVDEHHMKLRLKGGLDPWGIPETPRIVATQVHRPTGQELMVKLIEAAETTGGFLTVTKAVKQTGATFAEVEACLKEMLKSGYVKIDNDPVTGAVTYHFHELD